VLIRLRATIEEDLASDATSRVAEQQFHRSPPT